MSNPTNFNEDASEIPPADAPAAPPLADPSIAMTYQKYNTKAVISIILAVVALICCFNLFLVLLFGVPAVILGHLAYNETKAGGERGKELAMAGLVVGYSAFVLFLVVLTAFSAGAGSVNRAPGGNTDVCTWPTEPTHAQEQKCFDSGSGLS
jgi:uncharacterized membrane protein YidH (DUF202 family)